VLPVGGVYTPSNPSNFNNELIDSGRTGHTVIFIAAASVFDLAVTHFHTKFRMSLASKSIRISISDVKYKGGYLLRNNCHKLQQCVHPGTCCNASTISTLVFESDTNRGLHRMLTMRTMKAYSDEGMWVIQLIPSPFCQADSSMHRDNPKLQIGIFYNPTPPDVKPALHFTTKAGLGTPCVIPGIINQLCYSICWDGSSCPDGGCRYCQTVVLQMFYQLPNLDRSSEYLSVLQKPPPSPTEKVS
jgi:hypothetical protein